ncbi:hypothetical protein Desde_2643 [Desulfitobacterium dehalogenans ATCC 51507]|uniref:Uncharacterized protein n=1 Tax=Desulfitobacterium dehalogenans (strain ATCC 51507 / DSM 9161 / JW/IU-DC1) TaxID=756499 RepID=I4AAH6_DESDJ|nr:hypothetical protein Desde_2643 [Desulfitobacterium dehalogenans ATCC 51507]
MTSDIALEILEKVDSEYGLEPPDNSKEVKASDSKPIIDHTRTPAQLKNKSENIECAINNAEYEKKMEELGDVKWKLMPQMDEVGISEPYKVVGIKATKAWIGHQNIYPNTVYSTFASHLWK